MQVCNSLLPCILYEKSNCSDFLLLDNKLLHFWKAWNVKFNVFLSQLWPIPNRIFPIEKLKGDPPHFENLKILFLIDLMLRNQSVRKCTKEKSCAIFRHNFLLFRFYIFILKKCIRLSCFYGMIRGSLLSVSASTQIYYW